MQSGTAIPDYTSSVQTEVHSLRHLLFLKQHERAKELWVWWARREKTSWGFNSAASGGKNGLAGGGALTTAASLCCPRTENNVSGAWNVFKPGNKDRKTQAETRLPRPLSKTVPQIQVFIAASLFYFFFPFLSHVNSSISQPWVSPSALPDEPVPCRL